MYEFKINNFEGPLDLLLHLIKESKMEITDIEIVKLTDQYLDFIENMKNLDLNIASNYLVVASELMYLKSKTLLPSTSEEEQEELEEAKDNLQKRLLEYQKYKELTPTFKNLEEKRKELFTKLPSDLKEYASPQIQLSEDVTLNDLLNAFKNFLERKKYEEPMNTKITTKELSVEERIINIKQILTKKKKVEFFELFEEVSKPYVIVTFLSILEMAKKREMKITQENNFEKIYCEVF